MVGVAVSWVIRQPGITSAIIGVSRAEQLDANVAALEVAWDDELVKGCDALWWQLPRRPVTEGYR